MSNSKEQKVCIKLYFRFGKTPWYSLWRICFTKSTNVQVFFKIQKGLTSMEDNIEQFDCDDGVVHYKFVPLGQSVNQQWNMCYGIHGKMSNKNILRNSKMDLWVPPHTQHCRNKWKECVERMSFHRSPLPQYYKTLTKRKWCIGRHKKSHTLLHCERPTGPNTRKDYETYSHFFSN
jgi:hypothetical protein